MTKLTDTQARVLLDFALAQVQHLLPDPLPPKPAPGQPGFRGATYNALSVLEAQQGQATNLTAREAARLARLALAHEACDNFPPPETCQKLARRDTGQSRSMRRLACELEILRGRGRCSPRGTTWPLSERACDPHTRKPCSNCLCLRSCNRPYRLAEPGPPIRQLGTGYAGSLPWELGSLCLIQNPEARRRSPEHDISDNEAARSGDYF